MVETETYTIEGPGGDTKALEFPAGLVDVFAERSEGPTDVAAGVVVQAFAWQAHTVMHHSEGDVSADITGIDEQIEELFGDRLGVPLSDALGHSH